MSQKFLLAGIGAVLMLASLPSMAAAGQDRSFHQTTGVSDSIEAGDETGSSKLSLHRKHRTFWAWWHAFRCKVYERHAPKLYAWFCTDGGISTPEKPAATATPTPTLTPTPEPTATPTPEPTATPTPPPTPTGQASFHGDTLVAFFTGVGAGNEFGLDTNPPGQVPVGGNYAWSEGTYNFTFSRTGTQTFLQFTGPGPSGFTLANLPATCGDWDTVQVAITGIGDDANAAFRNVSIAGQALGDLADNDDGVPENHFWTFTGDYSGTFTIAGQLEVQGWDTEQAARPRLEFTLGCGQ